MGDNLLRIVSHDFLNSGLSVSFLSYSKYVFYKAKTFASYQYPIVCHLYQARVGLLPLHEHRHHCSVVGIAILRGLDTALRLSETLP
jgi:hypothetical protein